MKIPSKATLRKYGLSEDDYRKMYLDEGGKCPICDREFSDKVRVAIDHLHVLHYKKKSAEVRKRYVRGLVCLYCNFRVINKNITPQKARNIVKYLDKFSDRLSKTRVLDSELIDKSHANQ